MEISGFLEHLRQRRRTDRTIQEYRAILERFDQWLQGRNQRRETDLPITPDQIRTWLGDLEARGLARSTRRQHLCALRSYLTWFFGDDTPSPAAGIRVEPVAPSSHDLLDSREIRALERAARDRIHLADSKHPGSPSAREARRDRALLHLILERELRVHQVCCLDLAEATQLLEESRALGRGARSALEAWLRVRPEGVEDALFVGRYGQPLRPRGIQRILDRLAAFANLDRYRVTPETLRRSPSVASAPSGVRS